MKLNFNKRDSVIPDTNLGPPKTRRRNSVAQWTMMGSLAVFSVGNVLPKVSHAVPANPAEQTLTQKEGTTFKAKLWGDEWLNGWETTDGYTIVQDKNTGNWTLAIPDPIGRLVSSPMVVGKTPVPDGFPKHFRPSGRALQNILDAQQKSVPVPIKPLPKTGTVNLPVILVNFNNTTTTHTVSDFDNLLFGSGNKSAKKYFEEVSYGTHSLSAGPSGIGGWYTASQGHDYYGFERGYSRTAELVQQAVQAADKTGFDFAPYDNNGDCYVDVLTIIHQGAGAEANGDSTNIWSHYGHITEYTTNSSTAKCDAIKVSAYTIQPETLDSGLQTVGVFVHGIGRAMGLPALYDVVDPEKGAGVLDAMGMGMWNKVTRLGDTPAHLSAYSKYTLGWINPSMVTETKTGVSIEQVATQGQIYRFSLSDSEYYLIENRQPVGFDAGLSSNGVAIWRIDESNSVHRVTLVRANDDSDLFSSATQVSFLDKANNIGVVSIGASEKTMTATMCADSTPSISVIPTSINFGSVNVNGTSQKTITVSNNGCGDLQIESLNIAGDSAFRLQNDSCSNKTVGISGNCTIDMVLSPTANATVSAKLAIPSNVPDLSNMEVPLSGTACYQRFNLYSWPWSNPPDFGTEVVGNSTSMSQYAYAYTWGSIHGCDAGPKLDNISLTGANASEFSIDNKYCRNYNRSYNWGRWKYSYSYSYCRFNTVFEPTSEGTKDVAITAISDDSNALTKSLLAKAVQTGQPKLETSPSSVDFGTAKIGFGSSTKTVTVKNTGNVNLKVSDITFTGKDASDFSTGWSWCSYKGTLKPAEECSLRVSFLPTSAGAKQASLTVASNTSTPLTRSVREKDSSGVITAPLTGTAAELADCSDANITIQTKATIANRAWALDSDNDGNYTDHFTWDHVWADQSGNALNRVPNENDVVRINSGHIIIGIPVLAKVKALCVEQGGILIPTVGSSLEIQATDVIYNKGIIGKVEDANDLPNWVGSSGTIPEWIATADGRDELDSANCSADLSSYDCAQKGSDVILKVGQDLKKYGKAGDWWYSSYSSGGPILNEGKIIAGNGGKGKNYGAAGGDAIVLGRNTTNKDTIKAGQGGDIYDTGTGKAGQGGLTQIWGKLGGAGHLYNQSFTVDGVSKQPNISAGDGGNCTGSNTADQTGGRGGNLWLVSLPNVYLSGGNHASGNSGTGCAISAENSWVRIEPSVISLAGVNTKVRGGNIDIYGGNDWTLDLRNMSGVVIDATDNVTLAVGENGVIDLRGNSGPIIKAGGIVQLFADIILLDDGVKLSALIQATDIVLGPNKILHDVSLTGAGKKIGEPEAILPIRLTLANNGPEKDTYTLIVTDTAGWTLGELPSTIEIDGLEFIDLVLNVTLPASRGATDVITVTAISQADPDIKSVAKVHASVKDMTYTVYGSILDKSGQPVKGITVEIEGKTVVTDEQGHFGIVGLLSGDYTLNVSKEGRNLATQEITLKGDDSVIGIDIEIDTGVVAVPTPASCQLYAVNDKGLNNSQFFTVSLDDLTISELGPMYKGHDIEALAIHPKTDMIYAASGDNVTNGKKGHFYIVDGQTGQLFPVGSTGFNEIEDLAFSPDGTLYAWAKDDGLITIDLATGNGTLVLDSNIQLEGLTLKKNEGNVFFGAVGTDLLRYDGDTNTLDVICPNQLLGETEALEITPEGLLLVGTHNVPFGLHAFDAQTCQVIEADKTLSNKFDDVEGIALPVAACSSTTSTSSSCTSLAQEDLQVFETIFMEPFVLYMAIRSMVVVDYDVTGEWPIPLSTSITPPTGNFTAGFVSGPLHLEATMTSQAELEAALAPFNLDMANKACLADVAGKVIRFNFNPSTRIWSCSVNIPNGVPPQHLDLFPMKCD